MSQTRELGKRVELVSMDPHFRQITIALYQQNHHNQPEYLVHTYSGFEGAAERIHFVRDGMKVLGQLEGSGDWISFTCGLPHLAATRRTFLETCKVPSAVKVETRPLAITDKKSGRGITAVSLGNGLYQVTADGPEDGKSARIEGIVGGLVKLAEMTRVEGTKDQVVFPCGKSHDALIGLLLPRALNVRAALREEEEASGRGLLVAPSQQKS